MFTFNSNETKSILRKISLEDLMKYRVSGKEGFFLKFNNQLFLAESPSSDFVLATQVFGSGLCETCDNICNGCPKISDLTLSTHLGFGRNFPDSVEKYGRPEKYDFVTFAVEVFDQNNSNCIIVECKNFCERNPADYETQDFCETIWTPKKLFDILT